MLFDPLKSAEPPINSGKFFFISSDSNEALSAKKKFIGVYGQNSVEKADALKAKFISIAQEATRGKGVVFELGAGDEFRIIFDEVDADGNPVDANAIVAQINTEFMQFVQDEGMIIYPEVDGVMIQTYPSLTTATITTDDAFVQEAVDGKKAFFALNMYADALLNKKKAEGKKKLVNKFLRTGGAVLPSSNDFAVSDTRNLHFYLKDLK